MPDTIRAFMCTTDWDTELPHGQDARCYANIDMLRRKERCADECGIVEVEMRFVRVAQEPNTGDMFGGGNADPS